MSTNKPDNNVPAVGGFPRFCDFPLKRIRTYFNSVASSLSLRCKLQTNEPAIDTTSKRFNIAKPLSCYQCSIS
jgi:hypothetical protein